MKIKMLLSIIVLMFFTIIIYMVRPINKIDGFLFVKDISENTGSIERIIYAYRLKIVFNERLYRDIIYTSLNKDLKFCNKLCFISYYEVLKSGENHIAKEDLGNEILTLKNIVKNDIDKKQLENFFNKVLNESERKYVYCDYYKFKDDKLQYTYDCKGVQK